MVSRRPKTRLGIQRPFTEMQPIGQPRVADQLQYDSFDLQALFQLHLSSG